MLVHSTAKKRSIAWLICLGVMVFGAVLWYGMQQAFATSTEYEIYPTPHQVEYRDGSFIVSKEVNVVYDEGIDEQTKTHLTEVLASKQKTVSVSDQKVEGKTNVLVGIKGSGGYVDTYVNETYHPADDLFTHFGAYFFNVSQNEIAILGRDTDASFYGITTLEQIFNQIDGSTLRFVTINDYADVKIRGFIEGYYGMPWTKDDRIELMRFGGKIKMTSYIFAPKDDPYHKQKWRENYPPDELENLKEMVAAGNKSKCRFVWTAHPFMGGFRRAQYKEEIQTLINKFEHLYTDAGVRQFGVLGDDVGSLPRSIVVEMMQRVGEWAKSKGDVYDTVFCPGGYNHSWQGNYSELKEYDSGFPENIQIFWTGEAVCRPIEQVTLQHFRRQNSNGTDRRAPLFWLNWPVNDINHSRMIMGNGAKMLHNDITVTDLAGAVTNPMQESEPSKVAIFQLADFTWNVKAFDGDQTWKDSFKYIEPNAPEALYTLAKHMANPAPNGHGLVMPESVEIAPKIRTFKEKFNNNTLTEQDIADMKAEFQTIIDACDAFNEQTQNAELKKDLNPFTASLKDLSKATISFLDAKLALLKGNELRAFDLYTAGQAAQKASTKHYKPMLGGGTEAVDPGSTELIPFATFLEKGLSTPMNSFILGDSEAPLQITPETSFSSFYQGNAGSIADNNDRTHAWHNGSENPGQYFQLNLSKPTTIYGIHILNGAAQQNKERDTFAVGKVLYKTAGSDTWTQVGDLFRDYPEYVDIDQTVIENVVAVRYECVEKSSANKWPAMREFRVSLKPETTLRFGKQVIFTPNDWVLANTQAMIDGNKTTNVHFAVRNNNRFGSEKDYYKVGDYFGLRLSKPITLGKIDILQGNGPNDNDMFHASKLQYSLNGTDWTDIDGATFAKKDHITFDASDLNLKAQYVRLTATDSKNFWVRVREFDVTAKAVFNSEGYTNVEGLKLGANVFEDNASLQPKDNITLKQGEYVGLELDRIHEITSITKNVDPASVELQTGKNEFEFMPYTEGSVNARYVRLINTSAQPVTINVKELSLTTKEYGAKKYVEGESTFTIYDKTNNPASAIFDGDWTTQTIFQGSQSQGRKFVYDLGQTIDLNSLKVVCRDSEHDFPRHAKISVSVDGNAWTDIMEIGSQTGNNTGEAENQDNINDVLPSHETSYNTKSVELNEAVKARFMKFEITRTKAGNDKWVRFQEFIINNGEYMPQVNDPTFEASCRDTLGGEFAHLTDGNLSTHYVPNCDNGNLKYHVSKDNAKNIVKIVQAASPISHAQVSARIMNAEGETETVELGTLSQTVNEFTLPEGTKILDLTITWSGVVPRLSELILDEKNPIVAVDKQALETALSTRENTDTWTKATKEAYNKAIENALKVKESGYVSQSSVDSAKQAIELTIANKLIKGDVAQVQQLLDTKIESATPYTPNSWRNYQRAVAKLTNALNNPENISVQDVESLVATYNEAKDGLKYSPLKAEEATLELKELTGFIAAIEDPTKAYTQDTWNAFTEAVSNLRNTLNENAETPLNPEQIQAVLTKALDAKKALKALANVEGIQALLKQLKALDPEIYTQDSYTKLQDVITEVEEKGDLTLLKQTEIDALVEKLMAAKNALKTRMADVVVDPVNPGDTSGGSSGSVKPKPSKPSRPSGSSDAYNAYVEAYDYRVALEQNSQNTSNEEYSAARKAEEEAEKELATKEESIKAVAHPKQNESVENKESNAPTTEADFTWWVAGGCGIAAVVALALYGFMKKDKDEK